MWGTSKGTEQWCPIKGSFCIWRCPLTEVSLYTGQPLYKVTWYITLDLYNNTHVGNCFTGLCTKCTGYNNNNLVIAAQNSGTNGAVVVNSLDCIIRIILSNSKCILPPPIQDTYWSISPVYGKYYYYTYKMYTKGGSKHTMWTNKISILRNKMLVNANTCSHSNSLYLLHPSSHWSYPSKTSPCPYCQPQLPHEELFDQPKQTGSTGIPWQQFWRYQKVKIKLTWILHKYPISTKTKVPKSESQ